MISSERKLRLIESILKETNDSVLFQIEKILLGTKAESYNRRSFASFAGSIPKEDLDEMERAINESCGRI